MKLRTPTLAAGLVALLELAPALAGNTPISEYLNLDRTDYAIAAAGGIGAPPAQGGGAGTLQLSGVSGTVTLALLYWNGIDIEFPAEGLTGGDADYDQPQISFDGGDITGTRIGGSGSNDCWPSADSTLPASAATYRADVTDQVRARGNGDYVFSGLASKPGHSANGISLIVYFDDGNPGNDVHVAHYEGLQSNTEVAHFAFDMDYVGGAVEAILHASDGQGLLSDGTLTWNTVPGRPGQTANTLKYTTLHDGLSLWPGSSVPHLGHQRGDNSATLWDIRRMALAPLFGPARNYRTYFDYAKSAQDCVSVHVVQIVQAAAPQALMLDPNPHDFGDVVAGMTSAMQRFTFTNLMPGPVDVQTPTIADTQFHIDAQTCSGQTVPAGASCTIDVTFAPLVAQPAFARTTGLVVPFKDVVFKVNPATAYAQLRGTGVPSAPFSRLSFEPEQCTFRPTAVGSSAPPVRVAARSTGSLPLTIDSAAGGGVRFPLVATTCASGTVLQPGSACTLDLAFQPATPGVVNNAAYVGFHASDAPADSGMSMALHGTGIAAGDAVYADGFEPARCID